MWNVKVKWEREREAVRVNKLTDAANPQLMNACNALADKVIAETQAELSSLNLGDPGLNEAVQAYSESLKRADAGKEFPRKKRARGSLRPVSIVTTRRGAAISAPLIEYGNGLLPPLRPMSRAVYKLGGRVT